MTEKTVLLTCRITPESRKLLYDKAEGLVQPGDRLPIGRMISFMIQYFEQMGEWGEIEDDVREVLAEELQARKQKDRERKRRKPPSPVKSR
jgi:hypothetical protein